jgi:hypothetical protein
VSAGANGAGELIAIIIAAARTSNTEELQSDW